MSERETFLVTESVARVLGISPDDVVDLAQKGTLKGLKLSHPWIFRLSDVESYKHEHSEP
jgi:hypothetical protein